MSSARIARTDARMADIRTVVVASAVVLVHWMGSAAGTDTGGVPGPTDVRIQALAALQPDVLASFASRYRWKPAPARWDAALSAQLRPFAPTGGTWQTSDQFAEDVRTSRYAGPVYLDTTSGTVFLDVVGG